MLPPPPVLRSPQQSLLLLLAPESLFPALVDQRELPVPYDTGVCIIRSSAEVAKSLSVFLLRDFSSTHALARGHRLAAIVYAVPKKYYQTTYLKQVISIIRCAVRRGRRDAKLALHTGCSWTRGVAGERAVHLFVVGRSLGEVSILKSLSHALSSHRVGTPGRVLQSLAVYETRVCKYSSRGRAQSWAQLH